MMNRIINHTFLVVKSVKRCFSMRKFSHVLYDVVLLYFHRFLCKRKNAQLAKKKVLPACLSLNYNFFAYIMSETQWRRKNLHPTRNSSVVLKRLCAGALIGLTTITHMPSTWIFFARIDSWVSKEKIKIWYWIFHGNIWFPNTQLANWILCRKILFLSQFIFGLKIQTFRI